MYLTTPVTTRAEYILLDTRFQKERESCFFHFEVYSVLKQSTLIF